MTTIDPADPWRRAALDHNDVSAAPQVDASTNASMRTERIAANARYEAFAAGSGPDTQDECFDYDDPKHNYDPCVHAEVENPVLFLRQPSDADRVDVQDVEQVGVGDCYLMATLDALTATPEGRKLIEGAIAENRDDKGAVVSYTVTLHRPEAHRLRANTFSDVRVTVDGSYVVGHANARPGSGLNEVWPLVIEKAYAQYQGGYNAMGHGGDACNAMEILTGREATVTRLRGPASWFKTFPPERLQSDLAAGKLVVLQTRRDIGQSANTRSATKPDAHKLIGAHAYLVTGLEKSEGHLFVKLHNPWNPG
jgi:hypothetical protein